MSPKRKKTEATSAPGPEVRRLRTMLKTAMKVLGFTNRDVERKLGLSGSYLSRLFSGMIDLKVDHVVAISRVIGVEPEEMFQLAFPKKRTPSAAALRLRETLEEYQKTGSAPWGGSLNLTDLEIEKPAPPPAPLDTTSSELEQALEKMMAKALQKVLAKMA